MGRSSGTAGPRRAGPRPGSSGGAGAQRPPFREPPGAAGLMRVSATGGEPALLWRKDSMITMLPNALPGKHGVTFLSCNAVCSTSALWAVDLKGDSAHLVIRGASAGYYTDRG